MKLLRVGTKGNEKPATLDKNGKIRDLSSQIKDLNANNLNFETISKLKNINLEKLPELLKTDRIGTPEEVASLAVYLASDESDFVTGIVHPIDGGASI